MIVLRVINNKKLPRSEEEMENLSLNTKFIKESTRQVSNGWLLLRIADEKFKEGLRDQKNGLKIMEDYKKSIGDYRWGMTMINGNLMKIIEKEPVGERPPLLRVKEDQQNLIVLLKHMETRCERKIWEAGLILKEKLFQEEQQNYYKHIEYLQVVQEQQEREIEESKYQMKRMQRKILNLEQELERTEDENRLNQEFVLMKLSGVKEQLEEAKKNSFGETMKRTMKKAIIWGPFIAFLGLKIVDWVQAKQGVKYAYDYTREPL